MLHGIALAEHVAARIMASGAAERALVLRLPGWPSRTPPPVPAAIAVVSGEGWHVLAAVGAWSAIVAPPPPLAHLVRRFEWSTAGPDADVLARELATRWWREAPDAVGALDVAGAITHAASAALGAGRGAFGNHVYGDPGRGGAEVTARVGIGRERSSPRWPELADVFADGAAIAVSVANADRSRARMTIADVNALSRALPEITSMLRATDDACAAWNERLEAVRAAARALRTGLASETSGAWDLVDPFEIALATPPMVILRAGAPIGGTVEVHVSAYGAGVRVEVGSARFDVADAEARSALLPDIARAVHGESRVLTAPRLVRQARYRVERAFGGARPGDVLVFSEVAEVKPSGAEVWFFRGPDGHSVTLSSAETADCAVLDALGEYLTPLP